MVLNRKGKMMPDPEVNVMKFEQLEADPEVQPTLRKWLADGHGIAVYENVAMDSSGLGHRKFLQWGKPDNTWPTLESLPKTRLPDTHTEINWKYWFKGVVMPEKAAV